MGNIISRKGCAGKCGSYIYCRKNPFSVGWGKRGGSLTVSVVLLCFQFLKNSRFVLPSEKQKNFMYNSVDAFALKYIVVE